MPIITHSRDPFDLHKAIHNNVTTGTNLLGWLCDNYGDSDIMSAGLATDIILNGRTILRTDEAYSDEDLNFNLGAFDSVVIVNRPAGVDPFTIALIAVATVAAAALVIALSPSLPGDAGPAASSPNNNLNAATNAFRPGEAIPEVFGRLISYPDFIQPSYFEYTNNLKIVRELFCIGVGEYDVTDVKTGETLINDIGGSSFIIYGPGVTPAQELLTVHRGTNEVDGQVLSAPDDEKFTQIDQVDLVTADGIVDTFITLNSASTFLMDTGIQTGDYLTVDIETSLLNGTFQVSGITPGANDIITLDTLTGTGGVPTSSSISITESNGDIDNWLGWFDIPGDEAEEIWFHWQMPQGIRTEKGNEITMTLEFEIEILNAGTPSGTVFNKIVNKTGNTLDPQFITTKFTQSEFGGMTTSQYRGRVRRDTNLFDGSASQQVKVEDFVSVTPYTTSGFGDVTLISVERSATTFAVTSADSKINCDVTRKLPVYNRLTDTYDTGTLVATTDFADAAAYEIIVASGRSASTVDLAELYEINDGLSDPQLGEFSFTFDDFNVSLGERVQSICNAARVAPYRDGAVWRFTRDEIKPIRTALFNRRVMPGNDNSTQGWQLQRPDDKDSVSLTFVDPVTNTEKILYRRISGGTILSDLPGSQPLEIKLAGCRNETQANNRADLEIRRILYQRRTVNDTVMRDGLLVGLNDRVGWVDPVDIELFDGEILGFSGNEFDTSERFTPEDGKSYFVYITDDNGNPSNSVLCTARTDTEFGFVASGLSGAYLPTGGQQLGSRYYIGTESDQSDSDFLITKRTPNSDGTVDIELAEYVPEIYEND